MAKKVFKIKKRLAKAISYAKGFRSRKKVKAIVFHWTAGTNDTAKNNADYFATGNTREAGAHFFVGKKGAIYKSINLNRTAYAVGGFVTQRDGAASKYGELTNANTVSIELCALDGYPSKQQVAACKWLVKYIRKRCKNADQIVRHWDINGKNCPNGMTGKGNANWKRFLKEIA